MLKRLLHRRPSGSPTPATPGPNPPSPFQDQDTITRSQTGDSGNEATAVARQDEDAELAIAQKFILERQGARMRDELAKKRFKEASLQSQVDELGDEVRRLEKKVKGKDAILDEQEMRLGRLQREKEEAEEILEVAAETIRETRAQVQLLEERGPLTYV